METPPSYAPPKKSNTGLIIGLVLGGIAICCVGGVALLGFAGFNFFKGTLAPMAECMISYEAITESISDYADEHQGKLPPAATWQDELMPYVQKRLAKVQKEDMPFKLMDPAGEWSCTMGDKKTGMAFNTEVDGKLLADARKDDKIVIFEIEQIGRNVSEKYVPRDKSTSPKLMGERRGWITIGADGALLMGNKDMDGKFGN
jgi:hypothetical protein